MSLVEHADFLVNNAIMPYGEIWVVFDKDDFPDDLFNGAIDKAVDKGYQVGWSNESIELWFLLHFEYIDSGISRHQYYDKLSVWFKKHKIPGGKYGKNVVNIFDILREYGKVDEAIKRSERLLKMHEKLCNNNSKAKMKPATTVHQLVGKLLTDFEF